MIQFLNLPDVRVLVFSIPEEGGYRRNEFLFQQSVLESVGGNLGFLP